MIDLIAIAVVIAALSATLGALVAARSGRGTIETPPWVERLAVELASLATRGEAEASPPKPTNTRR